MPYHHLLEDAQSQGILSTVVGLIIIRNEKVLLLKRRPDDFLPNVWEIPGGHVDPGETIEQTLARELLEETGFLLRNIVSYVGGYDYVGEFGTTRQWNFLVQADGTTIRHPEHTDYRWATPKQWSRLPMSHEMRQSLDQFAKLQGLA